MRGERICRLSDKQTRPFTFVGDARSYGHHGNISLARKAVIRTGTTRVRDRRRPLAYTCIDAESFIWFARIYLRSASPVIGTNATGP